MKIVGKSGKGVKALSPGRIAWLGGDSVVHLSGLVLLARALATGEAAVILQAFQHNSFASEPARE